MNSYLLGILVGSIATFVGIFSDSIWITLPAGIIIGIVGAIIEGHL